MSIDMCKKCGEYMSTLMSGVCHCEPFIIFDEDGEEHNPIYAIDEQDAALKYAEKSNADNDYYLMSDSVKITVNGKKFVISAEPDIHYSARAVVA